MIEESGTAESAAMLATGLGKVSSLPRAVSGQGLEVVTSIARKVAGWTEQYRLPLRTGPPHRHRRQVPGVQDQERGR